MGGMMDDGVMLDGDSFEFRAAGSYTGIISVPYTFLPFAFLRVRYSG
jgi:hypothetical protein